MTKKYLLLIIAISSFKFASAQTLSSAPTLNFTNNTGISSDNIATDGDGGSVNISDIDIQIYNISDVNGTLVSPLSWENNTFLYSNNSSYSAVTSNVATGTKGMTIKSANGAEFKLNQFVYYNWGENSPATNTIKGFKNTIEVASTTFQAYDGGAFLPTTIILTTAFDDVDEVRFYISAGGYEGNQNFTNHSINSIQVSTAVLSSDSFELNSKIQIYPNPSTGIFNISIQEDANVTVNDILGKTIYTNKVKSGNNTIDISNYQSGIYLLSISNENGSITKKIIKE